MVTDLGTEFGVEVTPEGDTDAEVFRARSGWRRPRAEVMPASSACAAQARRSASMPVGKAGHPPDRPGERRAKTLRPRDAAAKSRRDSQAYAELVLSLRPAVYYRMERPDGEKDRYVVLDSAPGGHHGELRLGNETAARPTGPDASAMRSGSAGRKRATA